MADRLLALRTFVRAAHCGSFSRAARELGLSQPSVSRILAGLGVAFAAPEPATWAMLLLGFAGLGFAGYRKRSALSVG
jgi:hypothetical protein